MRMFCMPRMTDENMGNLIWSLSAAHAGATGGTGAKSGGQGEAVPRHTSALMLRNLREGQREEQEGKGMPIWLYSRFRPAIQPTDPCPARRCCLARQTPSARRQCRAQAGSTLPLQPKEANYAHAWVLSKRHIAPLAYCPEP